MNKLTTNIFDKLLTKSDNLFIIKVNQLKGEFKLKKNLKRFFSLLVLFALVFTVASCKPEDNNNNNGEKKDELNAYSSAYDKVVDKLIEEEVIGEDVEPIDMNEVAGYLKDNGAGGEPNTEAVKIADVARDYDGIYLVWIKLKNHDNDTSMKTVYDAMALNATDTSVTIVIGGGRYVLELSFLNGTYAIGFSDSVAEATKEKALEVFKAIDDTKPQSLDYLAIGEFTTILKDKGYWNMNEQVDLNKLEEYSYPGQDWQGNDTTKYNSIASSAYECNGIRVLYFNIGGLWGNTLTSYEAFLEDTDTYSITFTMGTDDDTSDDETYTIEVDAHYGYFVLSIDDTVANKAEIIAEFNKLAK